MSRGRASSRSTKKSKSSSSRSSQSTRSLGVFANSSKSSRKSKQRFDFDPDCIMDYRELVSALDSPVSSITLGNNIIIEANILINRDVIIDFNGYGIIADERLPDARVLDIRSGHVTLAGRGKIFAIGAHGVAIRLFGAISSTSPDYTHLIVEEGISIFAPDSYGILISPNLGVAYGMTLDFAGQMFAHDGICLTGGIHGHEENLPTANILDTANIIVDEVSGAPIEAAGYGKWQISAARFNGAVGARLHTGILNFNNTQILAQSGPVFALGEANHRELEVIVDGGAYASEYNYIAAGVPDYAKKFTLRSGEFAGREGIVSDNLAKAVRKNKPAVIREDLDEFLQSFPPVIISSPVTMPPITPESATITISESDIESSTNTTSAPSDHFSDFMTDASDDEQAIISELMAEESISNPSNDQTPLKAAPTLSTFFSKKNHTIPNASKNTTQQDTPVPSSFKNSVQSNISNSSENTAQPDASTLPPRPTFTRPPKPISPPSEEEVAARLALSDAIADIRGLRADDYEVGFAALQRAIQQAEQILANPAASLVDICNAANSLLQAFDGLEEYDDSSLSDEELDELFYHGAVLKELTTGHKKITTITKKKSKKIAPAPESVGAAALQPTFTPTKASSGSQLLLESPTPPPAFAEIAPSTNFSDDTLLHSLEEDDQLDLSDALEFISQEADELEGFDSDVDFDFNSSSDLEQNQNSGRPILNNPDFTVLSEALTAISNLNLDDYTIASREALLGELARAQSILTDASSTQSMIDEIAANLVAGMSDLEVVKNSHSLAPHIRLNSPAPIIKRAILPTMIDEMMPTSTWSQGVTMIDELTPFTTDLTTREKMLRSTQSYLYALADSIKQPLHKFTKSLIAGTRAGLRAYRETLHAGKNIKTSA